MELPGCAVETAMKVLLTGEHGFIGQHLITLLAERGHELVTGKRGPEALIHLAWRGIPDYENPKQMENVEWQVSLIRFAAAWGIKNIVIPGTIWETCKNPPPYALAKLELLNRLHTVPITLKWVRAPYLYSTRYPRPGLLTELKKAVAARQTQFRVVPGKLPFLPVEVFCHRLIDAMENDKPHIANIPGVLENVADFCRRMVPEAANIELTPDYPLRAWEQ